MEINKEKSASHSERLGQLLKASYYEWKDRLNAKALRPVVLEDMKGNSKENNFKKLQALPEDHLAKPT